MEGFRKNTLYYQGRRQYYQRINGEPAVKLYEDYFAKDALELAKELRRISIFYPIGIYLQGERNIFCAILSL